MRIFRCVLALLVLAAVAGQFRHNLGNANFDPANFFSYFTIVANIFGALVLLAVSFGQPQDAHHRDVLRGAAALSLVVVGVVFSLLLANLDSAMIPWANAVVHYIMPVAIALDWCLDPPSTPVSPRDAALWLALPAMYLVYSLVRGAIVHWYPYPFLDVDALGYARVAAYVVAIAVFAIVTAYVVMLVGNARRTRTNGSDVR